MRPVPASEGPLRVLHVIPTLTGGGAENFLCALVDALDDTAVRSAIMPIYPTAVPDRLTRRGVRILSIERRGRYDPGFLARMLRGMRAFSPDIVHAHLHNGKYWGRLAALVCGVPIVVFTEHSPHGERRSLPEALVDRFVNRATDGIVTFTSRQRAMLAKSEGIDSRKLRVIENGVVLPPLPEPRYRRQARLILGVEEDAVALVVLGRLEPVKNARLAVEAMGKLPASLRERVRLCVIGDGSQKDDLLALSRELALTPYVRFFGHRADAVRLLGGADALLLPSRVEGMPLAALEAMCVGVPVISTPWPGAEELLGRGSFGAVLPDWNPASAAGAIERICERAAEFREMGERAQRYARERYDIRRTARAHERFYRELAVRKKLR